MRFAIFGTGGVGGYFGGRLALAGRDVTFIARGKHLAWMQKAGLRVDSIGGDFEVTPVTATDSPQSIGAVNCIILAVKAWQLGEAIESIKPLIGDETAILPLMNGIEHMDMLADAFDKEHVLGGLCRISSFLAGPGHITHVGVKPFISFGELDSTMSGRVKYLQEIFASLDGVDVEVPSDIRAAMWEKFIFICSTSGVGAVTRQPMGVFRSVPESRTMLESAVREAVEVGRAKGVALPRDLFETLLKRIDGLPAGMVASMQKDIMEGGPSELDAQTGAVVRMGRSLGIPIPTHEFIYASLLPMELKAGAV
jgi:2-dehydropantoate 2-reductase